MPFMEEQIIMYGKLPKNIQQCGSPRGNPVIYIEEYVKSFIEEREETSFGHTKVFILVGETRNAEKTMLFITGAIEAAAVKQEENWRITEEMWKTIYEKISTYFPNKETVGWVITGDVGIDEDGPVLRRAHVANFGVGMKLLYMRNWMEKRDAFYLADKNGLENCGGYYVYYDKNSEMQSYMLECDKEKDAVADVQVREGHEKTAVSRPEAESVYAEGREIKEDKYRGVRRLAYSAAFFLVLVVFAVMTVMLRRPGVNSENEQLAENDVGVDIKNVFEELAGAHTENESVTVNSGAVQENNEKEEGIVIEEELSEPEIIETDKTEENDSEAGEAAEDSCDNGRNSEEAAGGAYDAGRSNEEDMADEQTTEVVSVWKTHIVAKGDTLAAISRMYYGTASYVDRIKEFNNLQSEDVIRIGQELLLPEK